ncbi:hypothetical protein [Runella sp.]|uniref:hypothetical protein n=1 Tax=Runella sp. TaxID=1960881 RepID=UPI003D0B08C7
MPISSNVLNMEVNAKFLYRNAFYSPGYAEHKMARIRKKLGLPKISVKTFCEFYKIDPELFANAK